MSYFRIHSVIQKIFILSSVPGTVLSVLDITLNLIQHNLTILIQTNECDSGELAPTLVFDAIITSDIQTLSHLPANIQRL